MPAYEMQTLVHCRGTSQWPRDTFRCGLARPAAELAALARLIGSGQVLKALEKDAVLYVENDEVGGERLARMHVEIARTVFDETLAAAPEVLAGILPLPMPTVAAGWDKPLRRAYEAYSSKPLAIGYREFDYVMPKDWTGKAALVSEIEPGRYGVHLLDRNGYPKDEGGKLSAILFAVLSGREVSLDVGRDERGFSLPETFTLPSPGLSRDAVSRMGTAAMVLAERAIVAYAQAMADLPVEGKPSILTDEDNDARDALLALLAGGSEIHVVRDADGGPERYMLDEVEVPRHLFGRIAQAGWLQDDGDWRTRKPAGVYRLSARSKVRPRDIDPRGHSVAFSAFSEKCRFRRWDCGRECANPDKNNQDNCNSYGCPLVTPVYRKEVDHVSGDPFFGWEHERDVEVTADHPGTERSYAWRASNGQRIEAIVNTVAHAYAAYRAGWVCSDGDTKAAKEAIAAGYLVLTEASPVGLMVALSNELKAQVEAAQAKAA